MVHTSQIIRISLLIAIWGNRGFLAREAGLLIAIHKSKAHQNSPPFHPEALIIISA